MPPVLPRSFTSVTVPARERNGGREALQTTGKRTRRIVLEPRRGRANTEVRAVKKLIDELTAEVRAGNAQTATVHAVVALQNLKLRAIELERRLEESDVRGEFESLKSVLQEHGVLVR
jgi:hypothetical protein